MNDKQSICIRSPDVGLLQCLARVSDRKHLVSVYTEHAEDLASGGSTPTEREITNLVERLHSIHTVFPMFAAYDIDEPLRLRQPLRAELSWPDSGEMSKEQAANFGFESALFVAGAIRLGDDSIGFGDEFRLLLRCCIMMPSETLEPLHHVLHWLGEYVLVEDDVAHIRDEIRAWDLLVGHAHARLQFRSFDKTIEPTLIECFSRASEGVRDARTSRDVYDSLLGSK